MSSTNLSQEKFWQNKAECDDAELRLHGTGISKTFSKSNTEEESFTSDEDKKSKASSKKTSNNAKNEKKKVLLDAQKDSIEFQSSTKTSSSLLTEIANARQHIKNSLICIDGMSDMATKGSSELLTKVNTLENENASLKKVTKSLEDLVLKLEGRVANLEKSCGVKCTPAIKEEKDDDVDLFGSSEDEEEDAEKVRIREERLKAYHEKKSKKPALIAKTSVLLDVKPWDDETDLDEILRLCKTIVKDGLVWGASKLVAIGYGIKKLQVMCVVEDEKVSIDELCEQIAEFEDLVQSVDVASMSKI